jgi:hypothetical protein
VTHSECLIALLTILARSPEQGEEYSALALRIPHGVNTKGNVGNTGVAILRIWWEDNGKAGMDVRGRLEDWGMADHLQEDKMRSDDIL